MAWWKIYNWRKWWTKTSMFNWIDWYKEEIKTPEQRAQEEKERKETFKHLQLLLGAACVISYYK